MYPNYGPQKDPDLQDQVSAAGHWNPNGNWIPGKQRDAPWRDHPNFRWSDQNQNQLPQSANTYQQPLAITYPQPPAMTYQQPPAISYPSQQEGQPQWKNRNHEVTKPGSQPVGAAKKKSKKKQLEVVVAETEKETRAPTEVATRTLRIQGNITMPSTSTAPEASPAHVSFADTAGQMDPWRSRLEGLVERIALNTDRIAQSSEAQTQLLTAQTEAQMRYNEEVRTAVFTVRDMVSLMARE